MNLYAYYLSISTIYHINNHVQIIDGRSQRASLARKSENVFLDQYSSTSTEGSIVALAYNETCQGVRRRELHTINQAKKYISK